MRTILGSIACILVFQVNSISHSAPTRPRVAPRPIVRTQVAKVAPARVAPRKPVPVVSPKPAQPSPIPGASTSQTTPVSTVEGVQGGPGFATQPFTMPEKGNPGLATGFSQGMPTPTNVAGILPVASPAVVVINNNNAPDSSQTSDASQQDNQQPLNQPASTQPAQCPAIPTDNNDLNNFRDNNFDISTIEDTQSQSNNCDDQCASELNKCYTGFTSNDNTCECATPK